MTVDELKRQLDRGETPFVLDVREAAELSVARFPFPVVHIPMGQLAARAFELPRDRTIVCACRSGARSAHAAAWLSRQGLDAVNLQGGILAWSRQIDPSIPQY
ncbi:MAG TPA: rhodanese-like domain-containing protein [Thermoanaerobaculia bacterium]|nr:rhodanese-like domain-containing protein [Thermoanaerobaculia bacterium]HQR67759.1 rhodanese-like domain-containing protein [Thermoanaerobaculia bacterium]